MIAHGKAKQYATGEGISATSKTKTGIITDFDNSAVVAANAQSQTKFDNPTSNAEATSEAKLALDVSKDSPSLQQILDANGEASSTGSGNPGAVTAATIVKDGGDLTTEVAAGAGDVSFVYFPCTFPWCRNDDRYLSAVCLTIDDFLLQAQDLGKASYISASTQQSQSNTLTDGTNILQVDVGAATSGYQQSDGEIIFMNSGTLTGINQDDTQVFVDTDAGTDFQVPSPEGVSKSTTNAEIVVNP